MISMVRVNSSGKISLNSMCREGKAWISFLFSARCPVYVSVPEHQKQKLLKRNLHWVLDLQTTTASILGGMAWHRWTVRN